MTAPLRLAFVTGSLVHGGAERHSITLVNRLAARGHECHAVYVKNDPSQLARLAAARGTVQCLEAARYLDAGAIRRFAARLSSLAPEAVVAANPYALMYATLANRLSRRPAPVLTTFHTTELQSRKEWLQMLAYRPLFWSAAAAVFVCERQRRHWLRRGVLSRRNEVIHNGVDTAHFAAAPLPDAAARAASGFGERDFVIGLAAVLRPEKNPVQLVEALAALRAHGLPARALFIGDGPLRGEVEQAARARGVSDSIRITGLVQDTRPWVAACDATTLCSRAVETFSLAALESMAMARPVVHADLGGAAEMIVPGENGFLFPPGDTRALVARLLPFADRALARRMGLAARRIVEKHFSEAAMVTRYERTLSEISRPERGAAVRIDTQQRGESP